MSNDDLDRAQNMEYKDFDKGKYLIFTKFFRVFVDRQTNCSEIHTMANTFQKLFLGASMLAGAIAVSTPALAGSITNPSIVGTDFILYEASYDADPADLPTPVIVSGFEGYTFESPNADLATVLMGDALRPGGNVELFASSESTGFGGAPVSITGTLDGNDITVSSVTAADWAIFGLDWFEGFVRAAIDFDTEADLNDFLENDLANTFALFQAFGGRETFSDPNVSYINSENGNVEIGLAGHLNARNRILEGSPALGFLLGDLLKDEVQASEIVRVDYQNETRYLYSFSATNSDLYENGEFQRRGLTSSHSGNYEVGFSVSNPGSDVDIPEPTALLGLLATGGAFVAAKRKSLKKA